jgi:hypothetical protein
VVFVDDINNIVANSYKSTAKLYAMYQDNTVDKYVTLPITVQDCSCCPLDSAKIIADAAYEGADVIAGITSAALSHFTKIPNAALCVWKVNQGNPVSANTGNSWNQAHTKCTVTMAADGYGDDWRLPNVAEMYHVLHKAFYVAGGLTGSSDDGGLAGSVYNHVSRFLSNTANASNRGSIYSTTMSDTGGAATIDNTTSGRDTGRTANYRCVKTINR